jgi:hypothetical protein
MKSRVISLTVTVLVVALQSSNSYSQTAGDDPTQLRSRQLEVRSLDANYDVAYRSATQALLSLGYSITHSDKTSGILTGSRTVGVTEMKAQIKQSKEEMKQYQEQVKTESVARTALGFVPYVGWLAWLVPGSQPPEEKEMKEASTYLLTMLLQPLGNKETQIRFKMQKDGEPVWDQTTIDRLWVTTQREAMIESGPSSASQTTSSTAPAQKTGQPAQKK